MQSNHRVLHRDDDLLPFTTSGYLNQPAAGKSSNAAATALKRHLAAAPAAPASGSGVGGQSANLYDHLGEVGVSKHVVTSRKVATMSAAGHAAAASTMVSTSSATYNSKFAKVTSTDDSETIGADQRSMMKRLKRIQNGGSAPAPSSAGQKPPAGLVHHVEAAAGVEAKLAAAAAHPGLITTSAWRVGETLVQKQLKEQQMREQQQRQNHSPIRQSAVVAAASAGSGSKKSAVTRTDCHLLAPSTMSAIAAGLGAGSGRPSTSKQAKTQSVPQSPTGKAVVGAPSSSSSTAAALELLEQRKSQKLEKREKLKKEKLQFDEDDERRKKAALKKQQQQQQHQQQIESARPPPSLPVAAAGAGSGVKAKSLAPPTVKPAPPQLLVTTSSVAANPHDDMSKLLKEKISHLLNDNDRFLGIDAAAKQQASKTAPTSTNAGVGELKSSRLQQLSQKSQTGRNYKFVSQRRPTQASAGDLETNKENLLFQQQQQQLQHRLDDELLDFNDNDNDLDAFHAAHHLDEPDDDDLDDENELDVEYGRTTHRTGGAVLGYSSSTKRHQAGLGSAGQLVHKKPKLTEPSMAAAAAAASLKSKRGGGGKMEPPSSASFEFAAHGSSSMMTNAAASLSANAIKNEDLLAFGTSSSGGGGDGATNAPFGTMRRLFKMALKVSGDIDQFQGTVAKVKALDEAPGSDADEEGLLSPVNERRLHPIMFENHRQRGSSAAAAVDLENRRPTAPAPLSDALAFSPGGDSLQLPGVGSLKSLKQKLDEQADEPAESTTSRRALSSSSSAAAAKAKKEATTAATIFKPAIPSSLLAAASSSSSKPAAASSLGSQLNKYYSMFKTVDAGDLAEQTAVPNVAMLLGEPAAAGADNYNFLNIYKKRGGSVPSSEYILNVINKRKQLQQQQQQQNDEFSSDFISASNKMQQRMSQQQQQRSASTGGAGVVNRAGSVLSNDGQQASSSKYAVGAAATAPGYDSSFSSESISKYMHSTGAGANSATAVAKAGVVSLEPLELMLAKEKKASSSRQAAGQGHHERHHASSSGHRHHHGHRHRSQSSKSAKLMSDDENNTSLTESTQSESQTSTSTGTGSGTTSSLTSASSTSSTSSSSTASSGRTGGSSGGSTATVTPEHGSLRLRPPSKTAKPVAAAAAAETLRSSMAAGAQQKPSPTLPSSAAAPSRRRHEHVLDARDRERDSGGMRYSPNSLERLLNVNLNYLDNLTMSELKLEELDKVRCIGLAQQETVALAHLIKDQQQLAQQQQFLKKSAAINAKYYQDDEPPEGPSKAPPSSSSQRQQPSSSSSHRAKHEPEPSDEAGGGGGGGAGNQARSASLSSTLSSSTSSINVANETEKEKAKQQQQRQRQTAATGKEAAASVVQPGRSASLSSTLSSSSSTSSSSGAGNEEATAASKLLKLKQQQQAAAAQLPSTRKAKRSTLLNDDADLNEFISDRERRVTINGFNFDDDDELEKSFRQLLPSESHIKRSKQEQAKLEQSLLYNSMFAGSGPHAASAAAELLPGAGNTSLSQSFYESHGMFLNPMQAPSSTTRLSFEDDSFRKFTSEIVKKYMQEEELRAKHQANMLKLREKSLIAKTNDELAWLEQMKKKVQDKGEDEKMPFLLKKEKGIRQKLREDVDNLKRLKETQRMDAEKRIRDLTQHSEVMKFYCKIKQQPGGAVGATQASSSTGTAGAAVSGLQTGASASFTTLNNKTMNDNFDSAKSAVDQLLISAKLKSAAGQTGGSMPNIAAASSASAAAANEVSMDGGGLGGGGGSQPDLSDNDEYDEAHDLTGGVALSTSAGAGLANQSLLSEPSKKYKHVSHLFSEKFLTEREKKLRLRRKAAEELIAWKKKLDDEELQVREIEKKAHQVLAKPAATATATATAAAVVTSSGAVASSGSGGLREKSPSVQTNKSKLPAARTASDSVDDALNEDQVKAVGSNTYSESFVSATDARSKKSSAKSPGKARVDDDRSATIRTSLDLKESKRESDEIEEEIEYGDDDDDEDAPGKTSASISTATTLRMQRPGAKVKAGASRSSVSAKTVTTATKGKPAVKGKQLSVSSSIETNIEEEKSTATDADLLDRKRRQQHEEQDDESTSVSVSLTATAGTETDLKVKVKELEQVLVKKKSEAEQLRQTLKAKEKKRLREKEEILRQEIESFDSMIGKMKSTLEVEKPATGKKPESKETKERPKTTAASSSLKPGPPAIVIDRRHTESIAEELPSQSSSEATEKPLPRLASTLKAASSLLARSEEQEQLETSVENEEAASVATESHLQRQETASSSSTASQPSKLVRLGAAGKETPQAAKDEAKYDEDDFDEATSAATQRSESKASSSSGKSKSSESRGVGKQELVFSAVKSPREKTNDADDDTKSTVSEISEEILGEAAHQDPTKRADSAASGDVEDPFAPRLGGKQASAAVNDTSSSSSSTDTQILLLGSRAAQKKLEQAETSSVPSTPRQAPDERSVHASKAESSQQEPATKSHDDTDNDELDEEKMATEENETLVKSPRPAAAAATGKASRLVDNLEEKLLSQAISQMIDIKNRKMAKLNETKKESTDADEPAKEAAKSGAATSSLSSSLPPLKPAAQPSSTPVISSNDLKILLPDDEENTFADDTAAIAAAAAAEAAEEAKLLSKLKKLNVPFNKKAIGRLVDTAIEGYFWKRLNANKSLLIKTPAARRRRASDEDEDEENEDEYDEVNESKLYEQNEELDEFFRTDMQAEIDEEETAKKEKETKESTTTANTTAATDDESAGPERGIREKEVVFKRMVLDSIGELMNDLYLEKYERPRMANAFLPKMKLMPKKTYFKTVRMAPSAVLSLADTKKLIKHKLFEILRLSATELADDKELIENDDDADSSPSNEIVRSYLNKQREKLLQQQRFRSKWRSQKRMDLVDKLLDYEMREQEYEWSNYELEEQEAKLAISDAILSQLLKDTIDCFQLNLLKREEMMERQS